MQVNDLMEVMSLIAKLNRTVDGQQALLNRYVEKYGPFEDEKQDEKSNVPAQTLD